MADWVGESAMMCEISHYVACHGYECVCVCMCVAVASSTTSKGSRVDEDPGTGSAHPYPLHVCHQTIQRGRQGRGVFCGRGSLGVLCGMTHRSCCIGLAWRPVNLEMMQQSYTTISLTCSEIGVRVCVANEFLYPLCIP